jgi:predicted transcriptional regulator
MIDRLSKNKNAFIKLPTMVLHEFLKTQEKRGGNQTRLSMTDFVVYIIFLASCNNDHKYSWLSVRTIANMINRSDKTIQDSISNLLNSGLIYRFAPNESNKKINTKLRESYCTRPLLRMNYNEKELVDERIEYQNKVSFEIEKKNRTTAIRNSKKKEKALAKQILKNEERKDIPEKSENKIYFGDDVPF